MHRYFEGDEHAALYKFYRPKTPTFIIKDIIRYVQEKRPKPLRLAIDVGCGSGQNTIGLADYFESVIGTDISEAQLAKIRKESGLPSNVTFEAALAENLAEVASDKSVDMLMGAMCVHWFDIPKFYAEVKRVLAPDGTIVVLGYAGEILCHPTDPILSKKLEELVPDYFLSVNDSYSPRAVEHLRQRYRNLDFPFEDMVRVDVDSPIVRVSVSHVIEALTIFVGYQNFYREKPKEALDFMRELEHKILTLVCGPDEIVHPSEATVHVKYGYFYLMGRVR